MSQIVHNSLCFSSVLTFSVHFVEYRNISQYALYIKMYRDYRAVLKNYYIAVFIFLMSASDRDPGIAMHIVLCSPCQNQTLMVYSKFV